MSPRCVSSAIIAAALTARGLIKAWGFSEEVLPVGREVGAGAGAVASMSRCVEQD